MEIPRWKAQIEAVNAAKLGLFRASISAGT